MRLLKTGAILVGSFGLFSLSVNAGEKETLGDKQRLHDDLRNYRHY
jgi:hypothetical protein